MRTAIGSIALAVAVAGAMLGCTGPESPEGAPCEATLGPRGDGMPDLEMQVGDTVRVPLKGHFGPVECLELREYHRGEDMVRTYKIGSSDPAEVAVSVSGSGLETVALETVAIGVADSVRVAVAVGAASSASSAFRYPRNHEFLVSVRPPSTGR